MSVTVAVVQFAPVIADPAANRERTAELITAAVRDGADLVVLPEASNAGYAFADAEEARAYAEDVPDGPACRTWAGLCAAHGIHLVAGITELHGGRVYNSAVLIGPDGHVGTYRKCHLWNAEKLLFTPGDLGFPVFETPIGAIAMAICYDEWFPETFRMCALGGADIVCVPANWVPVPGQPGSLPTMANMMTMTGAHSNLVYVAAASRVGTERGARFIGTSLIVDHTGWPLAGPADGAGEGILLAECDLTGSRSVRRDNPFNQPLRDRRVDVYARMPGDVTGPRS
jgi:predicted amidohydrolase